MNEHTKGKLEEYKNEYYKYNFINFIMLSIKIIIKHN